MPPRALAQPQNPGSPKQLRKGYIGEPRPCARARPPLAPRARSPPSMRSGARRSLPVLLPPSLLASRVKRCRGEVAAGRAPCADCALPGAARLHLCGLGAGGAVVAGSGLGERPFPRRAGGTKGGETAAAAGGGGWGGEVPARGGEGTEETKPRRQREGRATLCVAAGQASPAALGVPALETGGASPLSRGAPPTQHRPLALPAPQEPPGGGRVRTRGTGVSLRHWAERRRRTGPEAGVGSGKALKAARARAPRRSSAGIPQHGPGNGAFAPQPRLERALGGDLTLS